MYDYVLNEEEEEEEWFIFFSYSIPFSPLSILTYIHFVEHVHNSNILHIPSEYRKTLKNPCYAATRHTVFFHITSRPCFCKTVQFVSFCNPILLAPSHPTSISHPFHPRHAVSMKSPVISLHSNSVP